MNHLSDSVSIVDVSGTTPRVTRTLLVGDEPRDIVFAGPGGGRAFVTTAHRGQQHTSPDLVGVPGAGDPELTTPGVGRADVWVFDATSPGSGVGGVPVAIVTLFGDTPRALAVSPDRGTVYVAVFKSGNGTTTVSDGAVCNGFDTAPACTTSQGFVMPGGLPPPRTDALGEPAPETGLIVKFDGNAWRDELGRDWSAAVRFNLPDKDVFAIDATTLAGTGIFTGVGTTLFNMAVNPVSGAVYVSNTDAQNDVRFEGPGIFGGSTVQGHLAESRITILDGSSVLPRHLNKHIDYGVLPAPTGVKDHSLATPVGMAVTPDGGTVYVAAFGSSKIGVFDTAVLAADTFDPAVTSASYIPVTGGGPSGLVLDDARQRLYVLTRFDDAVSVVDLGTGGETAHLPLHNPEPASVVAGRPFLYDAARTSSNGEASCASCHDEVAAGTDPADPASVPGAPVPIETRSLTMSDDVKPPIDASKRRFSFVGDTKGAPAANRIMPPAQGGAGDPTILGATLQIYDAAGLTTDAVEIPLPASGWTALASRTRLRGYRFKGPATGPIKKVPVTTDTITVNGGKALFAYTLDEPAQGTIAAVLRLGVVDAWCAAAPAKPGLRYDHPGKFAGLPHAPAPPSCPAPPA